MGKWNGYDAEQARDIVEAVAGGGTLSLLLKPGNKMGWVTVQTFRRWRIEHPELQRAYVAAREISAESFEEEALDDVRDLRRDPGTPVDVAASRALHDQLRWSAARRNPEQYGDKSQVKVQVPVQINTVLNLGEGNVPSIPSDEIYTIETKGTVVKEVANDLLPVKKLSSWDPKAPRKRVLTPRVTLEKRKP